MIVPTVHLNGTAASALEDQLHDAIYHLNRGLEVLQDAAPHARDYVASPSSYFGGPIVCDGTAFIVAQREHVARVKRVEDVVAELGEVLAGVVAQRRES